MNRLSRIAALSLSLAGCAQPIGVFRPDELINQGRPREAIRVLQGEAEDDGVDLKLLTLHRGALMHAGGSWAESEAAFVAAETMQGYEPLPAEKEVISRLRATNALALRGDVAPLVAAVPKLQLDTPAAGEGAVVVLFERGTAPRARVVYDRQSQARDVQVTNTPWRQTPSFWQLDLDASQPAVPVDELATQWSSELVSRLGGPRSGSLDRAFGVDAIRATADAFRPRQEEWWTPPTTWLVGQRSVSPGKHVVTVTTVAGRRAQVVDVVAGQRVFVVVSQ